jgi:hypothetical protein
MNTDLSYTATGVGASGKRSDMAPNPVGDPRSIRGRCDENNPVFTVHYTALSFVSGELVHTECPSHLATICLTSVRPQQ